MPEATFVSDFWNDQLVEHDRQWLFLVLVGLVASFGFIRMSARIMRSPRLSWWPGSVVSDSGVHLHHLVWGICLMMIAGTISFAGFATAPIYEICAFLFGVGMGLTIDEFALWVHLDDVYWSTEGRRSVDAAVLAITLLGLLVVGVRPIDIETDDVGALISSVVGVAVLVLIVAVCLAKQRVVHAITGVFVAPLALYGALRLGKPGSPWARRFYGDHNPGKQRKAEHRFAPGRRTDRFKEDFRDAIGGSTEERYEAKLATRESEAGEHAATQEAAEEVRRRAERHGAAGRD